MIKALLTKIGGSTLLKVGVPAAGVAILTAGLSLWLYIGGLKSEIEDLSDSLSLANASLAVCNGSRESLRGAIEDQNKAVETAKQQSDALRERQEQARKEAQAARKEAEAAIRELRRESVASQTCEQARQALITEATGYVF